MDKMTLFRHRRSRNQGSTTIRPLSGFSLIELLLVIGVILLLATASVPALNSALRGSSLNRSGQLLVDKFSLARQEAITKNRDVLVRLYSVTNDGTTSWRLIRVMRIDQAANGVVTNDVSRITGLPDGVIITTANNLSPLITRASSGSELLPGYGQASYASFRYRADGSLESSIGTNNYVTLINKGDSESSPNNYYTVQINSLTGKSTVFRP